MKICLILDSSVSRDWFSTKCILKLNEREINNKKLSITIMGDIISPTSYFDYFNKSDYQCEMTTHQGTPSR